MRDIYFPLSESGPNVCPRSAAPRFTVSADFFRQRSWAGYFQWRQPGGSHHDASHEEQIVFPRSPARVGLGNQRHVRFGRGVRPRHEPADHWIVRRRTALRRNMDWMFQGKRFATMTLTRSGSGLTGTVTESLAVLRGYSRGWLRVHCVSEGHYTW
jgi:hypothetical protein